MIKLKARLNWGRWIADCPNCRGAEIVKPGEEFICYSCYPNALTNKKKALKRYEVVFPKIKLEIDKIMSKRDMQNRNWYPGETLKELRKENADNGVKE